MAKPLDPLSLAAFDSIKNVLAKKGLVLVRAGDTQHGLYGEDSESVLREMARNATSEVLMAQDEQAHAGQPDTALMRDAQTEAA